MRSPPHHRKAERSSPDQSSLKHREMKIMWFGCTNVFSYKYPFDCSNALSQNLNAVRFHSTERFLK